MWKRIKKLIRFIGYIFTGDSELVKEYSVGTTTLGENEYPRKEKLTDSEDMYELEPLPIKEEIILIALLEECWERYKDLSHMISSPSFAEEFSDTRLAIKEIQRQVIKKMK